MRESDAEAMWHVFSDAELMTWWSSPPHRDLAETRAYVAPDDARDPYLRWAITAKEGDPPDEALGSVVLRKEREGVGEIGYNLRRSRWGRGYAREAVARVLTHAFEDLGYRRVFADTDPDNSASNVLLEKLGFRREGYLRESWETHIGIRDSIVWGLLRHEWPKTPKSSDTPS
jgi:RimJ/RimL family protein N-acetyltransferase